MFIKVTFFIYQVLWVDACTFIMYKLKNLALHFAHVWYSFPLYRCYWCSFVYTIRNINVIVSYHPSPTIQSLQHMCAVHFLPYFLNKVVFFLKIYLPEHIQSVLLQKLILIFLFNIYSFPGRDGFLPNSNNSLCFQGYCHVLFFY